MKFSECLITFLLLFTTASSHAQNCVGYYQLGDCMLDLRRDYKIYSQSKSVVMNPTDTVEFNVVFYGQKDYICSFCTHSKFYPIHFILIDSDSDEVLYDNAKDKYIESLGMGFDATKSLTIRVDLLARKATDEEIEEYMGCLGMLIQYKNYTQRKVNLRMQ